MILQDRLAGGVIVWGFIHPVLDLQYPTLNISFMCLILFVFVVSKQPSSFSGLSVLPNINQLKIILFKIKILKTH